MPAAHDQIVIKQCPRCAGFIPDALNPGAYPGALSRWDNATEICSGCGMEEAMIDFAHSTYRVGGSKHLDPYTGEEPWVKPEVALTYTEIQTLKEGRMRHG